PRGSAGILGQVWLGGLSTPYFWEPLVWLRSLVQDPLPNRVSQTNSGHEKHRHVYHYTIVSATFARS
ncbi:MAG: hypothetical protein WCA27_34015, partial [Candidatus Sulfotelmatobacter sp.]